MYNQKKIAVIIAAAGSGNRMGGGIPKQYMEMQGKTVLSRSVEAFSQNCRIDEIYIAASRDYMDYCSRTFAGNSNLNKVKRIVEGGAERQDSVYSVLSVIPEEIDYVLVHDGARPFVTAGVIDALIECTVKYGAAVTAVPVKDTIKSAEEGVFTGTLDRSRLYSVQTPQGFERKLLIEAHERAYCENFYGTDDAVLVENLGKKVYLVKGDYSNIKITTIDDISTGEAIMRSRLGKAFREEELRVGNGFDVHRLVPDRKLVLGGVELPFEKGLLGHSDADVLLHAIMDALLGAAALGDIGRHFPDTDESYRGISSLLLLGKVGELLKEHDYLIGNIDSTVIAQRPKILPYIEEMKRRISEVLDLEENRINIKGTTTERLGFCGREEGIAAQASVTIKRRMNR